MPNRDAVDTIKGYYYQFDLTIKTILEQENENTYITVEGIEDIDITNSSETTAIQCKYHSKTNYNHSVIGKPIRLMLNHYNTIIKNREKPINYKLYCCFSSGEEKLTLPLSLDFLKDKLLTYTHNKIIIKEFEKLNISDNELKTFIKLLEINIYQEEFTSQFNNIIKLLKRILNCSSFEAEYYYYNNALKLIKDLSIENNIENRKISRHEFLQKINMKQILFNSWFLQYKGKKEYLKQIKNKLFCEYNIEYIERFFIIEVEENYEISTIKDLIYKISKKYTNIKKREPKPFCPYLLFLNINNEDFIKIKSSIYNEETNFIDGYPFKGSEFIVKSIIEQANFYNQIQFKLIDNISSLNQIITLNNKRKKYFNFYINNPQKYNTNDTDESIQIQIENISDIGSIIK
jgi:hypothetical protein